MSEKVTVELQILKSQKDEAKKIIKESGQHYDEYDYDSGSLTTWIIFEEVTYGNLYFLDDLEAAGIAFNSNWDEGADFGAGTESCRFTETGEVIRKELYNKDKNPDLHRLLDRLHDQTELTQFILNWSRDTSVLPWDNQEMYGKIYRTKKLIEPTKD